MALAAVRAIANTGTDCTLAQPLTTELISPSEDLFLHVEAGGTAATVTLVDGGTSPAGGAGTSVAVVCAISSKKMIYVSPALVNPATGLITVTFSNNTTITGEWLRV
jgi:hypothetical protein